MCKDELLRRQVLSTFPPIPVANNGRPRLTRGGVAESVSLYSKNKSSNGWSSSSSSNSAVQPPRRQLPRKKLTARLETSQPGDKAARAEEKMPGLCRNKTTLGIETRIHGDRGDSQLTARTALTTQRREIGVDKRRRESSSSNASSLPKMAPKKKASVSTIEEVYVRQPVQRELTVIIRYDEDECTSSRQNLLHERKLSFQPTLEPPAEGDEDHCDAVGFLEPTKSRTIMQWLEACEKARSDTSDEPSGDTSDHLPLIAENGAENLTTADADSA